LYFFLHIFSIYLRKDSQATGLIMKIPHTQPLTLDQVDQVLSQARAEGWVLSYLPQKHQLLIDKGNDWLAKLFLPWTCTWDAQQGITTNPDAHFSLVLVRAGQAAVGYFHQGQLIDHKVFRAYMVRQKQGKSQFKYLKTKGKSRAGSRIRLAETLLFFNEINERLRTYHAQYPMDFWGLSCGKTLWPLLFDAEVTPPFTSKTPQLIELPYHVAQASFEEVREIGKRINQYHLLRSELGMIALVLQGSPSVEQDSDDW
jgi:hypothetical protein